MTTPLTDTVGAGELAGRREGRQAPAGGEGEDAVQGNLAHKKQPPPHQPTPAPYKKDGWTFRGKGHPQVLFFFFITLEPRVE